MSLQPLARALAAGLGGLGGGHGGAGWAGFDGHDLVLSRLIQSATLRQIDYTTMTPRRASAIRAQAGAAQSELAALGALKSVAFERRKPARNTTAPTSSTARWSGPSRSMRAD